MSHTCYVMFVGNEVVDLMIVYIGFNDGKWEQ